MAIFLVAGVLIYGGGFTGDSEGRGILGGPAGADIEPSSGTPATLLAYSGTLASEYYRTEEIGETAVSAGNEESPLAATLQGEAKPAGIFSANAHIVTYKVRQGDTLSEIAASFGISVQTITTANPEVRARSLHIGEELAILPVSGIVYEAQGGETLADIAERFGLPTDVVREQNVAVGPGPYESGTPLVIPGGSLRQIASTGAKLPNMDDYFAEPTQGLNWGRLHSYNATDVANSCGTEIHAAAEGLVVDMSSSGWNQGYGSFITIEHPNGTETRYAHLQEIKVKIGDYVRQGVEIALMGNTGNVHGPTGCHLHFEVHGARNPFVKQ